MRRMVADSSVLDPRRRFVSLFPCLNINRSEYCPHLEPGEVWFPNVLSSPIPQPVDAPRDHSAQTTR